MRRSVLVLLVGVLSSLIVVPETAVASRVEAQFDLSEPTGAPFPSDRFTTPDPSQLTGLRVNLPKPDCAVRVSDCADIDVLNTLDGFNLQPRLSVPFSGPIDASTVSSETVFLVSLGHAATGHGRTQIIGINQIVWDVATNTLHVESDSFLEQHTRYALIVTRGIRDDHGGRVGGSEFQKFLLGHITPHPNRELLGYRVALLAALARAAMGGARLHDVVAASVFTTQSITAVLEKIRDQIKAATPASADFLLGSGLTRAVFAFDTITGLAVQRHVGNTAAGPVFAPPTGCLVCLQAFPGAVGSLALGRYRSPEYRIAGGTFEPVGTRTGTPTSNIVREVRFDVVLPSGPVPAGGWPVAIYGHTRTGARDQIYLVAATMARHGIATIAINTVGHGGGPLTTLTIERATEHGGPVTILTGGRNDDFNGDGVIEATEGFGTAPPRTIIASRDAIRQTVVDVMQLVRIIEIGVDVDGDGERDLDPERIYYFGASMGGIYGGLLVAVEPSIRAAVLNVPSSPLVETARLGSDRPGFIPLLGARIPSLLNVGGTDFDEDMPLRNEEPRIVTTPRATELQEFFDRSEWVQQSGSTVAYAVHIRTAPLAGVSAKAVIVQMARGDRQSVNPTTTAIIRAGKLADRTTFFRFDLAHADDPTLPDDPHIFLLRSFPSSPTFPNTQEAVAIALAAQEQVAMFFATDGTVTIDPDDLLDPPGPGPGWFEVPIVPPLPEDLGFIE